jgi:CBS-domain-containing membrane protein
MRERRARIGQELLLAVAPTATILIVMAFVEVLSKQRLLFASLASSAFLIYLDPRHGTNSVRTLVLSHGFAATGGLALYLLAGSGYLAAGTAMVLTIAAMIALDVVHPPAVATSLAFAFRAGDEANWILFMLAVAIIAALVVLERVTLTLVGRWKEE